MKELDRFELIIHRSKSTGIPEQIGDKLIALGNLLKSNQTLIKNLKDHGGNGMIVDVDGQNIGKWVYLVEEEKK